jgi:hypothetical protein
MLEMKNAAISYSQTLYHPSADFRLTVMLEKEPRTLGRVSGSSKEACADMGFLVVRPGVGQSS